MGAWAVVVAVGLLNVAVWLAASLLVLADVLGLVTVP